VQACLHCDVLLRFIRPITSLENLPAALATARREADASFGDRHLLFEKLITQPRHVQAIGTG
jgi:acetyl/propionyl-CoA carboxylase alpha subunit